MHIPIKLDKERRLLLGFEALQLFKKIHGKSLMRINFEDEDIEDLIPLIIYCGLKWEDENLTLEQTIRLIDQYVGLKRVMSEVMPEIMRELGFEDSVDDNEEKND